METRRDRLAVLAWGVLVATAVVVGVAYVHAHRHPLGVPAVPWAGNWQPTLVGAARAIVPATLLAVAVWKLPTFARRAPWPRVVITAAGVVAGLAFALAWSGPAGTHWTSLQFEYGQHAHLVDDWGGPARFLRAYVDNQPHLATHLRAHPPGMVLVLSLLARAGLSGTGLHLWLMLGGGAAATVAALTSAREVLGDAAARAATPFVVVAPVLVWRTNPDVIFGAVALTGVALMLIATSRRGRAAYAFASGGGLVFAAALFLTYGVALLLLPVVAVAWQRRRLPVLAAAALGVIVGLALPAVWGFWWPAGLAETHRQYQSSIAHYRGYRYWLLGNAAVYAVLIGPATFAAIGRIRDQATRALVFGALAAPVLAGLTGLSSEETERIWQPFVPLVLIAGAALWLRDGVFDERAARWWLVAQAVVALAFQVILRTTW